MKTAVILSARKDKDTEIPYPLKPYYENYCLIDRTIEALTALNYNNILLVVGGQAQQYQRYASETVRLVLNPDFKFTSSMGSLAMAAPYIKDDFLLVEGDTFYEYKVLKELSETKNENCFAITEESGSGDEAFVETRSGYITKISKDRHQICNFEGGGLIFYNLKTNKIRIYTTHESLPSNSVYALVKGADGKLWISTDKGLALMNHGKIVNLNLFKGLEREYKRMSVVCTSDGKIMFGSSDGVVSLASAFAKGLNYSAPLRIRGVEVEGVEPSEFWKQHIHDMLQAGNLQLSHHENTFTISFESINYQYQHDIQYQYYLEGFDRQWSKPSPYQFARFVNLPSGNYVLHVKAIGRSNGRELGVTSLQVHVAQPWWNTWWAWIVYLCILTDILYFNLLLLLFLVFTSAYSGIR